MTLPENINPGDSGHIGWHEDIAKALNTLAVVTQVPISNTTANSVLETFAIPAGRLVTNGDSLRMTAWGEISNSSGASVNYTFQGIFGTTAAITSNAVGFASSGSPRYWKAVIELARIGALSQSMSGLLTVSNASATNFPSTNSGVVNMGVGPATENQANALAFALKVQMGTASALASITPKFARVEYLPV